MLGRIGIAITSVSALGAMTGFALAIASLASSIHFAPSEGTAYVAPPETAPSSEPVTKQPLVVAEPAPKVKPARVIDPHPCTMGARVVAMAVDPDDAHRSLAVIALPGAVGFARPMVHPGELLGGRRVVAITGLKVWLDDGRDACFLDATSDAPPKESPKEPLKEPAKSTAVAGAMTKGIERVDDKHVRIDRALRDELMSKGPAAFMQVRMAPDMVDGKVVGMKLLGLPATNVLAQLGLKAGDSLKSINGFDITKPDQALEAFSKLGAAPKLELSLVRGGAPTSLTVDII